MVEIISKGIFLILVIVGGISWLVSFVCLLKLQGERKSQAVMYLSLGADFIFNRNLTENGSKMRRIIFITLGLGLVCASLAGLLGYYYFPQSPG